MADRQGSSRGRGARGFDRGRPPRRPGQFTGHGSGTRPREENGGGDSSAKRFRPDDGAGPSWRGAGRGGGTEGRGRGGGEGRGRGRGRGQSFETVHCRPAHITDKRGVEKERETTIVTNYFKAISTPNWVLHQYHVGFVPEIDSTRIKRALLNVHRETFGTHIFDGMHLFTAARLEGGDELKLNSIRRSDNENIELTLRFTGDVRSTNSVILQVLNILMKKSFRYLNFQQLNRNYYDPTLAVTVERHGLELWPGFVTAIHRHENDVLLHVDLSFKILRRDTVHDQIGTIIRKNRDGYKDAAIRDLVGCIILTRYNNRTYRIDDIDWNTSPSSSFKSKDGSEKTFLEYYRDHWNIVITDVHQPMLVSQPRSTKNPNQGLQSPILLVPELACMTGISDQTKNERNLMQDIGTYTRTRPSERVNKFMEFNGRLRSNPNITKEMNDWNLSFDRNLLEVKGRVLRSEKIIQGNSVSYDYDRKKSDWAMDVRNKELLKVVPCSKWLLLYTDEGLASKFEDHLFKVSRGMSLSFDRPRKIRLNRNTAGEYVDALNKNYSIGTELVVCLVDSNEKGRYDAIKKVCCIDKPVPSQVVVRDRLNSKAAMSIVTKVAIQLNCKLGGAAWTVAIPMKNIMVIGYDAYRDSSQKGTLIGAVCCSLDNTLTKYHSRVTFHTEEKERVDGLVENIAAGLKRFHALNNTFPSRIIMYRDGVSDGQLLSVRDNELVRILETFKLLGIEKPQFAYIVVSKRISTRLMEKRGPNHENPTPGTVVDTEITKPEFYDFFLVSQSCFQGTVTPTHYNVIHDTSNLKPDHIQRLTYKLTHLYSNWAGTIRVPAPCKYAYKLAFLTSQSLHKAPHESLADKLFYL